jgi:hypothetical protein
MCKSMAVFLAAALISVSCSDKTPTAPTTTTSSTTTTAATVRVSGRVLDYGTGRGVPNYTVRWWAGSNTQFRVGQLISVTDAVGRYEAQVPVTDNFTPLTDSLLFEIPESSGSMRVPAKSIDTDIIINPGGCNVRYGYVYDAATRRPIEGARVSRRQVATTDANGFYSLAIICDAPPNQMFGIGTTTISASHPAYQGTYELDGRGEWTGRPFIRRVDFALKPLN